MKLQYLSYASRLIGCCLLSLSAASAIAGGGVVLQDDVCKIKIGFYEAHFTAFQPETSGNRQFCEDLPDVGPTIFVLDYLHDSMKEVPIDFRIIRDVTGLGQFVRLGDVQAIADIDAHTVYYHPPTIETDASLVVEPTLAEEGAYIGIVTAGHPTTDEIYSAVFPFEVGRTILDFIWPIVGLLAFLFPAAAIWYLRNRVRREPRQTA
ncbi:MAG: hypothetical protein IH911_05030 [Proteobacteria bacterium]|nr:hypothetical protein [Pseudomonadota bacterium]